MRKAVNELLAACLVCTAILVLAASALSQESSSGFIVRSWHSEDGLPGSVVRSVIQAADGYVWVATAEGTVRFDGVRFTGFEKEPDSSLARMRPRWLFPMSDGSVWIATGRGGLQRWDGRRLRMIWDEAPIQTSGKALAQVIQVISDGHMGAYVMRGADVWHASLVSAPSRIERTPELEQLFRRDAEAWAQRGRPLSGSTEVHLLDRNGRFWTGTPAGDIVVTYADGRIETIRVSEAGAAGVVAQLYEDREGNIWAAASEGGLVQIRDRRASVLTPADGLSDRTVMTLLEDCRGAIWVAGRRGGVDRIIGTEVRHFSVGEGGLVRPVSALYEDRAGTLWAATRHGSIFHFDGEGFRPMEEWVKAVAILEDRDGRLWLGGPQGLAMVESGNLIRFGVEHGFTDSEVTALAVGSDNRIWVGSSSGHVFCGRPGRFELLGTPSDLGHSSISDLLVDRDESLWITTLGKGLFHWSQGRFKQFSVDTGLPDPRLTAVLEDRGYLWLGSLAGIFRVSKAALTQDVERAPKGINWLQLDRSDGLLSRECTGGNQPAAWKGRDGKLWFPTVNGAACIRPDQLNLNPVPPTVVLEECRANGRRLDPESGLLKVGPGRSRLEFRYTGLSFFAPEKVHFCVQLEGMESEWRDVGDQRIATFEAVPPGEYRFRVMAMNGDGVWGPDEAAVAIRIIPQFWETAWFRFGLASFGVVTAVGLGWLGARVRMRRRLAQLQLQAAREKERIRIAQDLHDDLGASLTEISILANLAAEEHGIGVAQGTLPEIATKAHALVGTLDEIVWAVNPRHDTLASLADYLAAFAADFLGSAGIGLRLEIARPLPTIPLETEVRHSLFLSAREALNNAVKHSGASEVWLRVKVEHSRLDLAVEDNGYGFSFAPTNLSEGLRNMRARLTDLGGECSITSTREHGTRVQFSLLLQ